MEATQAALWLVVLLVLLALAFDFLNGFHDAAHAIGTVVSTGVLRPATAVLFAAFFNFAAIAVFHLGVAATVAWELVLPAVVDTHVLLAVLLGALAWNLVAWRLNVASSFSLALVGGLIGATVASAGPAALVASGVAKTLLFVVLAPALGFALGSLLILGAGHLFRDRRPSVGDRWFRPLQLASAGAYNLAHGGADAQKTIGIIWLLLVATGSAAAAGDRPPAWVVVSCYAAISLGVLFGGWRVIRTREQMLTKLRPVGGFCAETSGALTLFLSNGLGIPVSTTHTITAAIVGVGATERMSAVRWGLAGPVLWAWILTVPGSALLAATAFWATLVLFAAA